MTTTFDPHAVELRDVVKKFGETTAVDHVTMTAETGTVLAFLGPNGAGKTTTIEMCEGFIKPTSGSIRVLGIDPTKDPVKLRGRIGIMLQGGGAYNGIRVEEMLQLTAAYSARPLDPEYLISLLGLEGVRQTTYRRLSGGQKQRLSLALALIGRPELVFLDEPTAGMDAQSRLLVWDLISSLRRDGVTVVLTTHLMDEAEALADKVVIIDRGTIVAEGTPAELTSAGTAHASVIAVETDREMDFSQLDYPVAVVHPLQYQVTAPAVPESLVAISAAAAQQGVLIRNLKVAHSNLEEIFLEITGRELRS